MTTAQDPFPDDWHSEVDEIAEDQFSEKVQKFVDSLEPSNVMGYTVAFGHAFDGITLEGLFTTFEEALSHAEATADRMDEWHIVPIWATNK